jgi:hypothetical protein
MRDKPRPIEEILQDAALPYQLGRLQGATIMVSHMLSLREEEELKSLGAKLNEVAAWFFVPEPK